MSISSVRMTTASTFLRCDAAHKRGEGFGVGLTRVEHLSTAEFATLSYASIRSAGVRPVRTAAFGGKRKSVFVAFFASFIAALHHSRRIQSRRTLRQYRHLIDQATSAPPATCNRI
jgi:hypothetical protein